MNYYWLAAGLVIVAFAFMAYSWYRKGVAGHRAATSPRRPRPASEPAVGGRRRAERQARQQQRKARRALPPESAEPCYMCGQQVPLWSKHSHHLSTDAPDGGRSDICICGHCWGARHEEVYYLVLDMGADAKSKGRPFFVDGTSWEEWTGVFQAWGIVPRRPPRKRVAELEAELNAPAIVPDELVEPAKPVVERPAERSWMPASAFVAPSVPEPEPEPELSEEERARLAEEEKKREAAAFKEKVLADLKARYEVMQHSGRVKTK